MYIQYISTYIPVARPGALGHIRSPVQGQPPFSVTFRDVFPISISYVSWMAFLRRFGGPEAPQSDHLG